MGMLFLGLLVGVIILFVLTLVPNRLRKPLIAIVTFAAGCFYAVEFFLPTGAVVANNKQKEELTKKFGQQPSTPLAASEITVNLAPEARKKLDELPPADARLVLKQLPTDAPKPLTADDVEKLTAQENFLTPRLQTASDVSNVLQAFAIGLGIWSLMSVHLRNIAMKRSGWGNSATLITSIFLMALAHIGKEYIKEGPFKTLDDLLYNGLMKNLDATMFSIIAFYIVSAAYRAFRIRSVEATILLVAAALVMLGNVPIGQALTNWIPDDKLSVLTNLRLENVGQWILKKASSPATQAIDFGLGVGALATSLRLWLSLERGSYFEEEL
jgi:hypothetical protein